MATARPSPTKLRTFNTRSKMARHWRDVPETVLPVSAHAVSIKSSLDIMAPDDNGRLLCGANKALLNVGVLWEEEPSCSHGGLANIRG